MERKELFYVLFWSFAIACVFFFIGFKEKAFFLFSLSLVGFVFVEKMNLAYALGAAFLAFAFSIYFGKTFMFVDRQFIALPLFLVFPFVLIEIRKRIKL